MGILGRRLRSFFSCPAFPFELYWWGEELAGHAFPADTGWWVQWFGNALHYFGCVATVLANEYIGGH